MSRVLAFWFGTLVAGMTLGFILTQACGEPRKGPLGFNELTTEQLEELAQSLLDYGMWREEQDRNSFPNNMAKAGEPYDSFTGEVLR
jgi:hypothetical protein